MYEQPRAHLQPTGATTQGDFAEDDAEASGDFASLDEFAHILDGAGGEEVSAKQKEWEARTKKNKKGAKGAFFPPALTPLPELSSHTHAHTIQARRRQQATRTRVTSSTWTTAPAAKRKTRATSTLPPSTSSAATPPSFLYDGTH